MLGVSKVLIVIVDPLLLRESPVRNYLSTEENPLIAKSFSSGLRRLAPSFHPTILAIAILSSNLDITITSI
jgi:hypothetical protein